MTRPRIPETYKNQDWPRKVSKEVNEINRKIDSGEIGGANISTDAGNSIVIGTDGGLFVPPILPDSASVQLSWLYLGTSAGSDPGAQYWTANSATAANVTEIYVSNIAWPNRTVANVLGIIADGDVIFIQERNFQEKYIWADVVGTPTDNGTYFTIPISVTASNEELQINQFSDFYIYHGGGGGDTPTPSPGLKDPVFTYDGDFLIRIDYDDGSFKTFDYVGENLDELVFQPNGGTTVIKNFFYDAQGRLTNIVET